MNLGDRINKLRTQQNLSQGDLAEALNVSRQSISKWETGASTPDLDKIIKLSELFNVSLDELVLDKPTSEATPIPDVKIIYTEKAAANSPSKTAGVVLLCFSALIWLTLSMMSDFLSGLVLAIPFLTCGLICLFSKRNAGLWSCWVIYFFVELYLRLATGVSVRFVLNPLVYAANMPAHLIVAWALLVIFAALAIVTIFRFRVPNSESIRRNIPAVVISWGLFLGIGLFLRILEMQELNAVTPVRTYSLIFYLVSTLQHIVLVGSLTHTVRLIIYLRTKKNT